MLVWTWATRSCGARFSLFGTLKSKLFGGLRERKGQVALSVDQKPPCLLSSHRSAKWNRHVQRIWWDHCQEPAVPARVFVAGVRVYLCGRQVETLERAGVDEPFDSGSWMHSLTLALEPSQPEAQDASIGAEVGRAVREM